MRTFNVGRPGSKCQACGGFLGVGTNAVCLAPGRYVHDNRHCRAAAKEKTVNKVNTAANAIERDLGGAPLGPKGLRKRAKELRKQARLIEERDRVVAKAAKKHAKASRRRLAAAEAALIRVAGDKDGGIASVEAAKVLLEDRARMQLGGLA